jgi:hypothetical protein
MYKKGNYIAFMTKQPEVHLNVMFGYNDLTEADFEKTEHIGFILSVIDDKTYLVMTVRPMEGFRCIVDNADILHSVNENELTKKELAYEEMIEFTAPNVYHSHTGVQGDTLEEKCINCAKEAMENLFPNEEIPCFEFCESDFLKADLLNGLQGLFDLFNIKSRDKELEEACTKFEEILQNKHFKEYYTLRVGVYENTEKKSIYYYYVAIDLKMKEVVIMRNIDERTRFFRSLGPDYDYVYECKMNITRLLMKD